jgi:glycosyltransferase involved in cell wall biosynthesis
MRVLHLHSGNMYGGVETLLATLVREAAAAPGMRPDVALCFPGRLRDELEAIGRPAFMLDPFRLSRPHALLKARHQLRRLLREQAFDAVVCHQPWACVAFGPVVRAAGFPVVLWVHQPIEGGALLDRLARRVRPDLAICNSRFTQSRVREWLPGVDTEVVYGPVAEPAPGSVAAGVAGHRSVYRRELATPEDDVVVMTACRMEAWKGHRVLLAALERLRAMPGWTCWVVGGAQTAEELVYERELRDAARVFGLESRLRFAGQRSDVRALLRAADVYCQANTAPEAFGVSFVEALYAGLPIVTSALGGALELVDPECGYLLPPGDTGAISDALRALIVDGDMRARMGSAARGRPAAVCDPCVEMRHLEQVLAAHPPVADLRLAALAG